MKSKLNNTIRLILITFLAASPVLGDDTAAKVGQPLTLKGLEERAASFTKLEPMLGKIADDSKCILYEGLPHQFYNPKQLEKELKTKTTVTRFGFPFYEASIKLAPQDAKDLKALIQKPESFGKFGGEKLCGGFHPDFSLVYEAQGGKIEIHFCFGCSEIRAYQEGSEVYCEMARGVNVAFMRLLKKYDKQRPQPKNKG